MPMPQTRIAPTIADDQLFGGVDIAGTLTAGRVIASEGLLARPLALVVAMAERTETGFAARLCQHLDRQTGGCLILLDEWAEPDETVLPMLLERLAFHVDLEGLSHRDIGAIELPRSLVGSVTMPESAIEDLTRLADRFGVESLRAPMMAVAATRAHVRLQGRTEVTQEDVAAAAALVYPSRATQIPDDAGLDAPETANDNAAPEPKTSDRDDQIEGLDRYMLVEAVHALLPPGLLDRPNSPARNQRAKGSGAGQKRAGNRRGRPLPPRPGRLDGRTRIDLIATLRAAAPWQPMRRRTHPDTLGLIIRPTDIRLRRFQETSDRLLIFTVDASGSAAVSRLNEAKGAVELLLGEAYTRRDQVALIAFRGTGAELLLPPTRSLVQTKRRLAALPGGGGTPLAAGLSEAGSLATLSRGKGITPTIVVMTDGRANIALDGTLNRPQAAADSEKMAESLRRQGIPGLMIDMSNRPQPALKILAGLLDAPYVPLPRADARRLSSAVNDALASA